MKSVYDRKENCCGCSACKQICPTQSIQMQEDENGYLYPIIISDSCIECGACIEVCPLRNKGVTRTPQISCAYVNPNEEYRFESASSGAFETLSREFLKGEEDYSVYGCELDDELQAKHCSIQNIKEISRMKKSKYIQSRIDNEYASVLQELRMGKKVVFSGTPCQISALKLFLKREYENLLTIDFVCHGVPSQKIFSKYIEYLEKRYKGKVRSYTFRNKRRVDQKWSNLGIRVDFVNGKSIELEAEEDLYMTGFLSGLFNRESCYKCKYAGINRISDITIGDFWGIEKVYPELTEIKTNGTSLVMGNTLKGLSIIQKLEEGTLYFTKLDDAVRENGQLKHPQKENVKREVFLYEFSRNRKFDTCIRQAFPEKYGFRKEILYQMKFYIMLSKTKQCVIKMFKRF